MESFRSLTSDVQRDRRCANVNQSTDALSTLCSAVDEEKKSLFGGIQNDFESELVSYVGLNAAIRDIETRFILLRKIIDLRDNGLQKRDRSVDIQQYFVELAERYSYLALDNFVITWSRLSSNLSLTWIDIDEDMLTILLTGIVDGFVRNKRNGFIRLSYSILNESLEVCVYSSEIGFNAELILQNYQVDDSELSIADLPLDAINFTHLRFFSRLAGARYLVDTHNGFGMNVTISIPFRPSKSTECHASAMNGKF